MPALVILFSLRIKDPFFLHRILISLAVITIFIGDILFIDYAGEYVVFYDMFYNFSYICAIALIWYYKLSQLLTRNIDFCIKESTDLIKRTQQFIDKDNSEINGTKGPEGAFENIYDPNSAQDYLRTLLNDAQREIQVLLSPMAVEFIKEKGNL